MTLPRGTPPLKRRRPARHQLSLCQPSDANAWLWAQDAAQPLGGRSSRRKGKGTHSVANSGPAFIQDLGMTLLCSWGRNPAGLAPLSVPPQETHLDCVKRVSHNHTCHTWKRKVPVTKCLRRLWNPGGVRFCKGKLGLPWPRKGDPEGPWAHPGDSCNVPSGTKSQPAL